jgi:hypothetical protein
MTNLRCPLANRTTCTQGLPPTLSDLDPVKGAMETDFFPRVTILLGPRCKQGDSVEWDPVGKNQDFQITRNGPSTSGDAIVDCLHVPDSRADSLAHYYTLCRCEEVPALGTTRLGTRDDEHPTQSCNHGGY